jgi:transcriptional regulator with XRE-family HTH domain
MKDRIKKYIDYKGVTAGELAVILDVQRSNISHILNGRNMPGAAFIEKLLIKFTDLDARWLLTGEGEMIVDSEIYISANKHEELPATGVKTMINEEIKEKEALITQDKKLERIVLLYSDGSFEDYKK